MVTSASHADDVDAAPQNLIDKLLAHNAKPFNYDTNLISHFCLQALNVFGLFAFSTREVRSRLQAGRDMNPIFMRMARPSMPYTFCALVKR